MSLRPAVDHPDLIRHSPQVITHLLETRPVEEAGDCDEAHDSRVHGVGCGSAGVHFNWTPRSWIFAAPHPTNRGKSMTASSDPAPREGLPPGGDSGLTTDGVSA